MQYCSLQHQTLLLSLVTSTTGCCFCFYLSLHSFWSYFSTNLHSGEGNGNALQYSCLENPMDGSLVGCSPRGREELDTTEWLYFDFSLWCIGEGNGNPLQCSCLENPRDGGAWWAAVYGVAQSQTWLKWLSSSSSNLHSKSGIYWSGEFILQCPIFCPFMLFIGFSRQEYWSGLPFPSL